VGLVARRKTDAEVQRLFKELTNRPDWSQLKTLAQQSKEYQPTEILYQELGQLLKVDL
jgi:glycosyl transferase, putative